MNTDSTNPSLPVAEQPADPLVITPRSRQAYVVLLVICVAVSLLTLITAENRGEFANLMILLVCVCCACLSLGAIICLIKPGRKVILSSQGIDLGEGIVSWDRVGRVRRKMGLPILMLGASEQFEFSLAGGEFVWSVGILDKRSASIAIWSFIKQQVEAAERNRPKSRIPSEFTAGSVPSAGFQYVYACEACGATFSSNHNPSNDERLAQCEFCGQVMVAERVGASRFVLKLPES